VVEPPLVLMQRYDGNSAVLRELDRENPEQFMWSNHRWS
jgi:hypothetical protein